MNTLSSATPNCISQQQLPLTTRPIFEIPLTLTSDTCAPSYLASYAAYTLPTDVNSRNPTFCFEYSAPIVSPPLWSSVCRFVRSRSCLESGAQRGVSPPSALACQRGPAKICPVLIYMHSVILSPCFLIL